MEQVIYNNFFGGIADSQREVSGSKFEVSKHFDIFSDPKRLLPYPTIANNINGVLGLTNKAANVLIYQDSGGANAYILGQNASLERASLFINSGSNAIWEAVTSGESSQTKTQFPKVFLKYSSYPTLNLFGLHGNYIWKFDVTGATFSPTFVDVTAAGTSSATNSTNGIIGTVLVRAYIPVVNRIYEIQSDFTTVNLVTFQTQGAIIGMAFYGNYIAILDIYSFLYFWDYRSISATETKKLPDAGFSVLGNVGDTLVAVGQKQTPLGSEIIIVSYDGGSSQIIFRKIFPSTVTIVRGVSRSRYGNMYFAVNDSATGRPYQGIWCVGRKKAGYPLAVTIALDYLENGGTASNIVNFDLDYTYIYIITADYNVHKISGTTYASVSPISTWETTITRAKSNGLLRAVSLSFSPIPATIGSISLAYKIDAESSWTTIFTETTADLLRRDAKNVESTGVRLPLKFNEIRFKVSSLGGVAPTELKFKWTEEATEYDNG